MKKIIFCFLFSIPFTISSMDFFAKRNWLVPFDTKEYYLQTGNVIDDQNSKIQPLEKKPLSLKTLALKKVVQLLLTPKYSEKNNLKLQITKDAPEDIQFLILEEFMKQSKNQPPIIKDPETRLDKFLKFALLLLSKKLGKKYRLDADHTAFFKQTIMPLIEKILDQQLQPLVK